MCCSIKNITKIIYEIKNQANTVIRIRTTLLRSFEKSLQNKSFTIYPTRISGKVKKRYSKNQGKQQSKITILKDQKYHREQKFTINGKAIEILNFISNGKHDVVHVEILSNGNFFTVTIEELEKAVNSSHVKGGQLVITECKNGYQVKSSSGKMFALEYNGNGYNVKQIKEQPMTGALVHGIPDKIKSIIFKLQKNV